MNSRKYPFEFNTEYGNTSLNSILKKYVTNSIWYLGSTQ